MADLDGRQPLVDSLCNDDSQPGFTRILRFASSYISHLQGGIPWNELCKTFQGCIRCHSITRILLPLGSTLYHPGRPWRLGTRTSFDEHRPQSMAKWYHDKYLAGLWRRYLLGCLRWKVLCRNNCPNSYRAPSWSCVGRLWIPPPTDGSRSSIELLGFRSMLLAVVNLAMSTKAFLDFVVVVWFHLQ